MLRMVWMAAASFDAPRGDLRFGIAMGAMMPIIATTIINSISEKPFWPRLLCGCFTALPRVQLGRARLSLAPSAVVSGYAPVSRLLVAVFVCLRAARAAASKGKAKGKREPPLRPVL